MNCFHTMCSNRYRGMFKESRIRNRAILRDCVLFFNDNLGSRFNWGKVKITRGKLYLRNLGDTFLGHRQGQEGH